MLGLRLSGRSGRVFLVIPRNGCQGFVNDHVEVIARRRTLVQRRKRSILAGDLYQ